MLAPITLRGKRETTSKSIHSSKYACLGDRSNEQILYSTLRGRHATGPQKLVTKITIGGLYVGRVGDLKQYKLFA